MNKVEEIDRNGHGTGTRTLKKETWNFMKKGERIPARIAWRKRGLVGIHVGKEMVAIIDAADLPTIQPYSWHTRKDYNTFYAVSSRPGRKNGIQMHRLILDLTDPKIKTDHQNGNGLDNRRENLRACTNAQNIRNQQPHQDRKRTRFKGVAPVMGSSAFTASITYDYKKIHLGTFPTEEAAARAYDAAAIKLHGPFARPNFPAVAA